MFKASVGNSEDIDSSDAADEVISQVKADLNGVSPAAGLLCCSINNDLGKIVASINAAFPGIELIGCTSYGENSSVSGFSDESVTFMAFASDTISMKAGLGRDVSKDGEKSARMAVESARAALGEAPKLAIALPESYRTNGAAFTRGLSAFSDGTTVVGGFAADQLRLKETRQFYKNEVLTDSAPILVFGGPVLFSLGRESGWAPLAPVYKLRLKFSFFPAQPLTQQHVMCFGTRITLPYCDVNHFDRSLNPHATPLFTPYYIY